MKRTKLPALTLSLLMGMTTLSACSIGGLQKELTFPEIPFENAYHTEAITGAWNWNLMDTVGENAFFVKYKNPRQPNTVKILVYNTKTGKSTEFEPAINKELQAAVNYAVAYMFLDRGEGKTGIVCTEFAYDMKSGTETPVRRCIEVYDENWELLEVEEIPEDFALNQTLGMLWSRRCTITDAQGNWYHCDLSQSTIHTYNDNYQKYGEIPLTNPEEAISSMVRGSDGAVYVLTHFWDGMSREQITHLYRLDAENRTAQEINLNKLPDINALSSFPLVNGSGDYLFYYITSEHLYGMTADGNAEEVIHWNNSDFVRNTVVQCLPLPDGRFLLGECTSNTGGMSSDTFYVAQPRTAEESAETKFLTLAAVDLSAGLEEAVLDYNKQNTGWRIMMVDYPDAQAMKTDLLSGVVADIICTENLHFENLASKDLFADWYPLMDADEEFCREDYLPNFFEALEYDGKLLRLTYEYSIETYFAKSAFAPLESYNTADYVELVENSEIDIQPYIGKHNVADSYLYSISDAFVNWQTGECRFDSPEFVRLLEWTNDLPENRDEIGGSLESYDKLFLNDDALLRQSRIYQPIRWHIIKRAYFKDADITPVGVPMYEGTSGNGGTFLINDSVSINAQSAYKDAAWDFMKYLLSADYQKGLSDTMPIHMGVLDEKLELATKMNAAAVTYTDMTTVNVGAATQESMDELRSYISGISRVRIEHGTDAQANVHAILTEELQRYFADGCTAQECARTVQSRVSIYLGEQS